MTGLSERQALSLAIAMDAAQLVSQALDRGETMAALAFARANVHALQLLRSLLYEDNERSSASEDDEG